jgi:hypothetical protein
MEKEQNCPWCKRAILKGEGCGYMIACGLDDEYKFHNEWGCGRASCFVCGKKYCSQQYDLTTGKRALTFRDFHNQECCSKEVGFIQDEYCAGGCGHNHCLKRW